VRVQKVLFVKWWNTLRLEIKEDFKVFGLTIEENKWEEFIVGEDYEAFIITKKENI
jgi:hypothetical protein